MKKRMTDGVSEEDMLGTLRVYGELLTRFGYWTTLGSKTSDMSDTAVNSTCFVHAIPAGGGTPRLLWFGSGPTPAEARASALQQAHSEGMPRAFSEQEARLVVALAGEEAFRPACRNIEAFAGAFEGRW